VWLHANTDPPLGGLAPPPNPILAAHSDDGGKSFSKPVHVNDPERGLSVAPALALGENHAVHVLYYDLQDDRRDYQGLEGPTWEGRWSLVSTTSSDGGNRFRRGVVVDDRLKPPERVMLIYTMPPPTLAVGKSGRLFAAWYDARAGDWDVFMRRSNDSGQSWQQPVRLNDVRVGNGRHQYQPNLSVAPSGRIDAIFYDRRADPKNKRNHVYYTYSTDEGRHFAENVRVSSASSDSKSGQRYTVPSAKGLVEFGGRVGLLSRDSGALAAWTDTRNIFGSGNRAFISTGQDIFTAEITPPPRAEGSAVSPGHPTLNDGGSRSAPFILLLLALLVFAAAVGLFQWLRRAPISTEEAV